MVRKRLVVGSRLVGHSMFHTNQYVYPRGEARNRWHEAYLGQDLGRRTSFFITLQRHEEDSRMTIWKRLAKSPAYSQRGKRI